MSKCYDDYTGPVAEVLRDLVGAIMSNHGGSDLLPVDPEWDPGHAALITRARAALADYDAVQIADPTHTPGCPLRTFVYEVGSGEPHPECMCHKVEITNA